MLGRGEHPIFYDMLEYARYLEAIQWEESEEWERGRVQEPKGQGHGRGRGNREVLRTWRDQSGVWVDESQDEWEAQQAWYGEGASETLEEGEPLKDGDGGEGQPARGKDEAEINMIGDCVDYQRIEGVGGALAIHRRTRGGTRVKGRGCGHARGVTGGSDIMGSTGSAPPISF